MNPENASRERAERDDVYGDYSVSELDRYFDELEGLGEREKRLADHLRELRRGHDIDEILKILGESSDGP